MAGEAVSLIRDWFFTHTCEDLLIATTQRVDVTPRRLLERAGATHAPAVSSSTASQEGYEFHRATPPLS
jgi:hypothetical protein